MRRLLLLTALLTLGACAKYEGPIWSGAMELGTLRGDVFQADAGWTGRITESPVEGPREDLDRVLLHFDLLRSTGEGRYDIRLTGWSKPLTKPGLRRSTADPDAIGSDPIMLVNGWFSGGYINMEVCITAMPKSKTTHFLNLVLEDVDAPGDTLRFRLHHNGYGEVFVPTDPKGTGLENYAFGNAYFCVPYAEFLPEGKDEMPIKITWPWYETDGRGYTGKIRDISRKGTLRR